MANRLFVFGLGFSGLTLARSLMRQGWSVAGTCQCRGKQEVLAAEGIEAYWFEAGGPMTEPAKALASASHVLLSIPPNDAGDPPMIHHGADIAVISELQWIGYLSTTGVYGDAGGEWVDEATPLNATSVRSVRRVDAERSWLESCANQGAPVHIFRLAGIYGPGRSALDQLRAGKARRIDKPGHCFGRIHVEDIAGILRASMDRPDPGSIYNVCDDLPAEPSIVTEYASALLGLPPPPLVSFEQASGDMSPMALTFWSENRKVGNDKVKRNLGYEFMFPTYREGLRAIFDLGG